MTVTTLVVFNKQTKREWWEGNKQRLTPPHVSLYHQICTYSDGPPPLVNLAFTLSTAIVRAVFFTLCTIQVIYYS